VSAPRTASGTIQATVAQMANKVFEVCMGVFYGKTSADATG
jgi:hypothetical protein